MKVFIDFALIPLKIKCYSILQKRLSRILDISNCDVIYYVIYVICSHYVGKAISPLFAWPSSVISQGLDFLFDVDLADVSNLARENNGVKYLLIVIDVFSRYLWVQPLKSKQHGPLIEGLRKILASGRIPKEIRSDKGSEFKNRWVNAFFKEKGIHHYVTQNETKANYAERVIRTIKSMFYRYFTHNRTYRYLDILQDMVHNYNNRPHRSLDGLSPADVTHSNEALLWKKMYVDVMKPSKLSKKKIFKRFKFKKGDFVRISSTIRTFQRDYEQKWTEEIFIIERRYLRQRIPVYKITDYDNDPIEGTFYESELQRVNKDRHDLWKIEKVLKRRQRRGVTEVLVKWLGYPKKFNSWIKESDLQDV